MIPRLTTRDAFLESILHDRHVVLGVTLQPFCLDHWCILDALDSPLLYGGAISIHDLQLAVKACASKSVIEFYDWSRRPGIKWSLWAGFTSSLPVAGNLKNFNNYVEDYVPEFPRWSGESEGSDLKCPPLFLCAARMVARGHDSALVRRMPIGELIAWNLACDEATGAPSESLMSDEDHAAVLEIEKEAAHG